MSELKFIIENLPAMCEELDQLRIKLPAAEAALAEAQAETKNADDEVASLKAELTVARQQLSEAQRTWRCFFCDFSTADPKEAAAHFGDRDDESQLQQQLSEAQQERDEAKAEVAACLQFLSNELEWEGFRANVLYAGPDDEAKKTLSENNARKLINFLKKERHGISLHQQIAQQEATISTLRDALEEVVNERYSELDMQTCKYARGTPEAEAWHQGVFSMWAQLKLIQAPARAALAKAHTGEKPCERS